MKLYLDGRGGRRLSGLETEMAVEGFWRGDDDPGLSTSLTIVSPPSSLSDTETIVTHV